MQHILRRVKCFLVEIGLLRLSSEKNQVEIESESLSDWADRMNELNDDSKPAKL